MSRQIGIQLDGETERKAREIAEIYKLPAKRHITQVITRAIDFLYMFEMAKRSTLVNIELLLSALLGKKDED